MQKQGAEPAGGGNIGSVGGTLVFTAFKNKLGGLKHALPRKLRGEAHPGLWR